MGKTMFNTFLWLKIFFVVQGATIVHGRCKREKSTSLIELYNDEDSKQCSWDITMTVPNNESLKIEIKEKVGSGSLILFGNTITTSNEQCLIVTPPGSNCVVTNTTSQCDVLEKKGSGIVFNTDALYERLKLEIETIACQDDNEIETVYPTTMRLEENMRKQETTSQKSEELITRQRLSYSTINFSTSDVKDDASLLTQPEKRPRNRMGNLVTQKTFPSYNTSAAIISISEKDFHGTSIIIASLGSFLIVILVVTVILLVKQTRQTSKWKNSLPHKRKNDSLPSVCNTKDFADRLYESIRLKKNSCGNVEPSNQSHSVYVEMAATFIQSPHVYANTQFTSSTSSSRENFDVEGQKMEPDCVSTPNTNDVSPYVNMDASENYKLKREPTYVEMRQKYGSLNEEKRYVNLPPLSTTFNKESQYVYADKYVKR